ncbi:GNAT family N-acetyltransferase [Luteococcus sp. H138]|uniref:GNAT family N-acetyltransferase n=1 Tax=unclassified Luteococcus TaxID=2639923 RepID=UPI00313E74EF
MTSQYLVQATTAQDAIDLMLSAPLAFDSPTNHRLRDRTLLERAFASGRRRPAWVWAARDEHRVLATVAGLGIGDAVVLDHWGGAPTHGLDLALHAATQALRTVPGSEACLHLPATASTADPTAKPWLDALSRHGWKLLVQRHHYETPAVDALGQEHISQLRLEQLTGPDDPRLRPLFRGILRDSRDAHDIQLVDEVGLDQAADRAVDDLLEADPWQCIRLAFDGNPDPVGMVSWVSLPGGRGYVNHVGVSAAARGHGFGRDLLALATRELVREGAATLIADTDASNVPMTAAFTRVGWTATETRLDFIPA